MELEVKRETLEFKVLTVLREQRVLRVSAVKTVLAQMVLPVLRVPKGNKAQRVLRVQPVSRVQLAKTELQVLRDYKVSMD